MKYTIRKYDGDDRYSYAIFKKSALPKGHRGVVFHGEATPVYCGMDRYEANYRKKDLEAKHKEKK